MESIVSKGSGCCGAIAHHLSDSEGGLHAARQNIDAWWPEIEANRIEAIVVNASGCGVMVKDYGHLLEHDPQYAHKAKRVSELTRDPIELLEALTAQLAEKIRPQKAPVKLAFHPPCTLQHGLKIRGAVEKLLTTLGAELVPVADSHLCCGSAGTYSVTQPQLSSELKKRKLSALQAQKPEMILSANVGCITHLQSGTDTPVRHWVEWVDEQLA